MLVFLNIDDTVIITDSWRKSQLAQMNLVEFHIYVYIRDVNETRETRDSKKFLGIEH